MAAGRLREEPCLVEVAHGSYEAAAGATRVAAFEAPPLLAGCLNRLEAEAGKQRLTNWFIGLDAWQIVKTLAPMSFFKLGTQ